MVTIIRAAGNLRSREFWPLHNNMNNGFSTIIITNSDMTLKGPKYIQCSKCEFKNFLTILVAW